MWMLTNNKIENESKSESKSRVGGANNKSGNEGSGGSGESEWEWQPPFSCPVLSVSCPDGKSRLHNGLGLILPIFCSCLLVCPTVCLVQRESKKES